MIKKISMLLLLLYLITAAAMYFFGSYLRDAFSPHVEFTYGEIYTHNETSCYRIPAEAVRINGEDSYVFLIIASSDYEEHAYEVIIKNVNIVAADDSYAYIEYRSLTNEDKIAVNSDKELSNGCRVTMTG